MEVGRRSKKGMLLVPDLSNAATRLTIITNCKPKVAGKGLLFGSTRTFEKEYLTLQCTRLIDPKWCKGRIVKMSNFLVL